MREARRLGVPIIALVDTNCDPDEADFIIPGNDDAIRSCSLIVKAIADGIAAGQSKVTPKEMAAATATGTARRPDPRSRGRGRRPEEPAAEATPDEPVAEATPDEPVAEAARSRRSRKRPPAEPEPETVEAPAAETTEEETA